MLERTRKDGRRVAVAVSIAFLTVLVVSSLSILPAHAETLGSWNSTNTYGTDTGESCATYLGYIYCIGGFLVGGPLSGAHSAQLSSSGVGTWSVTTTYPTGFNEGSCVIYLGYIYCVGGSIDSEGDFTNAVYSATVSSGAIGTWDATTDYPIIIAGESCAAGNGYIYCVGGTADTESPNTPSNAVEYATLSSGTVGSWTQADYPQIMNNPACAISGTDIYCVGGKTIPEDEVNPVPSTLVDYASIASGLGSWTQTTLYPTPITWSSCATSNGYIYCVGGGTDDAGDFTSDVYYAPVSSSGVGTWSSATSYPQEVYLESCVTSSGYLYCVDGQTDGSFITGNVEYSAISGVSSTSTSTSSSTTTSTSSTSTSVSTSTGPAPMPSPPPSTLPPVIPSTVNVNFNAGGGSQLTGSLVGPYGPGLLYNFPGYNSATDGLPSAISVCYMASSNLEVISGFFSVGPGNNSTELLLSNWSSFVSNAQGWPSEPACS